MEKYTFDESVKSMRQSSLKNTKVSLKCTTDKEIFEVSIRRIAASATISTKRAPEIFELRAYSKRKIWWPLRFLIRSKTDHSVFNNPYELIREIGGSTKLPSASLKEMLISKVRDVYKIPKPSSQPQNPVKQIALTPTTPGGENAKGTTTVV